MKALVKTFEGQELRAVPFRGDAAIVAKDMAKAIGYSRTADFVELAREKYRGTAKVSTPGGTQEMTVLTEPGMWQALSRTRKKKAEPLQDWINEVVLPEARKEAAANTLAEPKTLTGQIERVAEAHDTIEARIAEKQKEIDRRAAEVQEQQHTLDKAKALYEQATGHSTERGLPLALSESSDESEMDLTDPIVQHIVDEARELKLDRPLVVFDLETTGVKPEEDRIVQIAMQRLVPDDNGNPVPCPDDPQLITYVDPEREIPSAASAVSGITTADVSGMDTFASLAEQVERMIEDADLMGYNIARFDMPLLRAEFVRTGYPGLPGPGDRKLIDCYLLEKRLISHSLGAAYQRYTGREMQDAHDAWGDVRGTYTVLTHQLKRIPKGNTRLTAADLHDFAKGPYMTLHRKLRRDGDAVVLCFGRHKGRTLQWLQENEPSYIHSFMTQRMWYLRPVIREQLGR